MDESIKIMADQIIPIVIGDPNIIEEKINLRDVFNSSNDFRRHASFKYGHLSYLLDLNIITMFKTEIPVFVDKIDYYCYIGGGDRHKDLAKIYCDSTRKMHNCKFEYEYTINGKRVDIYDSFNNVIIECGDTEPDMIRIHLERDNINQVTIVPFQHITNDLEMWVFRTNNKEKLIEVNTQIAQYYLSLVRLPIRQSVGFGNLNFKKETVTNA